MKKNLFIFLCLSVFLTSIIAENNQPILTVLDFETNEISSSEMNSIINILSSGLFKTGYFIVIDIAQRETVLTELEFSLSGCTDEGCMLEVGKLLSAELIVIGSMSRIGSKIVLSAKMIETETSKTISTADGIYTDMDDLLGNLYPFIDSLSIPYAENQEKSAASENKTIENHRIVESAVSPQTEQTPEFNIPAFASAAGGVAAIGFGTYFLAVSIPLLSTYTTAQIAYTEASADADFTTLYNAAEAARIAALEGNANQNFILGAALSGAGLGLGILSTFLFLSEDKDSQSTVNFSAAVLPFPGATSLSFHLDY